MINEIRTKLYEFNKTLQMDKEDDIARITSYYFNEANNFSEFELRNALSESLNPYIWNSKVRSILESADEMVKEKPLVFTLKDLYHKLSRQNHGELYRHTLQLIERIVNLPDDTYRTDAILNELAIQNWIPEIRSFMLHFTSDPRDKENYANGTGKGDKVYTITENVSEGTVAFISDKWFLFNKKSGKVEPTLLENHVKDQQTLQSWRLLEMAIKTADISDDRMTFSIDGNLSIGLSFKNPSRIFLNEELAESESSLESIFEGTLVPYAQRGLYQLIAETKKNLKKFIDLDVCLKITNRIKPQLEAYLIKFEDNYFVYNKDFNYGTSFYAYENLRELVEEIKVDFDYDPSFFFGKKIAEEMEMGKSISDQQKVLKIRLGDVESGIKAIEDEGELWQESQELDAAHTQLITEKFAILKELEKLDSLVSKNR